MGKKAGIIIGMCVVIAAVFGVVTVTNRSADTDVASTGAQMNDATAENIVYIDGNDSENDAVTYGEGVETYSVENAQDETADDENADGGNDAVSDEVEQEIVSTHFTIQRVVDAESGEEYAARVVFGSNYRDAYADFGSDGSFKLYLDTGSGVVDQGTYTFSDGGMEVSYIGDRSAFYEIITDVYGNLEYIIVPYAGYDVYFGA